MSWFQRIGTNLAVLIILHALHTDGRTQVVQDGDLQVVEQVVEKPEQPASEDVEVRRDWLRSSLSTQLTSERQLRLMNTRVAEMTEAQLDRAIATQKRKLRKLQLERKQMALRQRQQNAIQQTRQLQALQAMAVGRNQYRSGFADGLLLGRYDPVVAYAPVVTWLPSGATLHAYPAISSDGRRVRVTAVPRFSHVGPVNSFDFVSGRSSRHSVCRPEEKPRIWYDGLRTRYGIPSGPFRNQF